MKKVLILLLLIPFMGRGQIIYSVAGTGVCGYNGDSIAADTAKVFYPYFIVVDKTGNCYWAEEVTHRVRMVDTAGIIHTVAGDGSGGYHGDGGPATAATLGGPVGVALDGKGNLYIGDLGSNTVRKVDTAGIITTIAGDGTCGDSGNGGPATAAELCQPGGVAIDKYGNIYVSDVLNNKIKEIDTNGIIRTIAGNGFLGYSGDGGPAIDAEFYRQVDVAVDNNGYVYIADVNNQRVRKIGNDGIITTIAGIGIPGDIGDGIHAIYSEFNNPMGVAVDARGNVYIADQTNHKIRKINTYDVMTTYVDTGAIAGFWGDGGYADTAHIGGPSGVTLNAAGDLWIADEYACRVRRVIDSTNYWPFFVHGYGHIKTIALCAGHSMNLDTAFEVTDFSSGNTDQWYASIPPSHGTLACTYSATSTGGNLYPSGIVYSPSAGYTGDDTFMIQVTDGKGGDSITVYASVSPCTTGVPIINGVQQNTFTLFPDPVKNDLNISSVFQINDIVITDMLGRCVFSNNNNNNSYFHLNVADFPGGVYLIRINGWYVTKFVKE